MPHINRFMPDSGEPGDRFTARIEGDDLSKVNRVSLGEGIAVSRLNVIDDGSMTVKLDISGDADIGLRDLEVTDSSSSGLLPGGFEVLTA